MNDNELMDLLLRFGTKQTVGMLAAQRIKELKRDLARANQRLGLYMHHASKKKKATR